MAGIGQYIDHRVVTIDLRIGDSPSEHHALAQPTVGHLLPQGLILRSAANEQQLLRPGMTATATIVTETRRNVLLSPNAALRFAPPGQSRGGPPGSESAQGLNDGAGPRVWVLRDGAPVAIPVTPGATDGRFTEIVKGELVPGTAVLTDVVTP